MTPILAVTPLLSLLEQIAKDGLHRLPVRDIGLIKSHHVDKDDVPFVHEEVAEEVEIFRLGYPNAVLALRRTCSTTLEEPQIATYFLAVFTQSKTSLPLEGMMGL